MGQILLQDNIPDLVIATNTTITMATTYLGKDTRITVGGQQYRYTSTTTINFATTGLNALDAGAIAANTLYYIYAVVNGSGTIGLVASTSSTTTGPTGYARWKEIGRCRTLSTAATLAAIANRDNGIARNAMGNDFSTYIPMGSWTTNTTYTGRQRRVCSSIEIYGKLTFTGLPATGDLQINNAQLLNGLGLSVSSTVMNTGQAVGSVSMITGGGARAWVGIAYWNTAVLQFFQTESSNIGFINPTSPGSFANGDFISFHVTLPIAEWQGLYT